MRIVFSVSIIAVPVPVEALNLRLMQPAVFWDGTPSGKVVKLGGIESYIAEPKSKTGKAVVLFPDVWGEEKHRRGLRVFKR